MKINIDHISHSSLSALNVSPQYFLKYKRRELKDDTKALDLGSAIHCYVLENKDFHERYAVMDVEPVGGMMGTFIESYAETSLTVNESMPVQLKIDTHQTLQELAYDKAGFKIPLQTVLNKFNLPENKKYFDFLVQNKGKTVLSQSDMDTVSKCALSLKAHKLANFLTTPEKAELEISWKHDDMDVKSIIDNLIFDLDNKTIYLVDLKTTSKSVYNFERSYFSYGYYRQMAMYKLAVHAFVNEFKEAINGSGGDVREWDLRDMDVKSYIVVVQTTGLNECVVYEPSAYDITLGIEEISNLISRLKWHIGNDQWEYPMEYYANNGSTKLKLSNEYISRIKENS